MKRLGKGLGKHLGLIAALLIGSAISAQADTDIWTNVLKQKRGDDALNIDSSFCDAQLGAPQNGTPTSAFLKVNLMVAYRPDEGADKLMVERQPFMRDLFNGYLRGLTENDVRGMAGILYIKAELLKRARAAVGSDLPQEILIKDLIVQ